MSRKKSRLLPAFRKFGGTLLALAIVLWVRPAMADEGCGEDHAPNPTVAARRLILAGKIDAAEAVVLRAGEEIEEVERLALQGLVALQRREHEKAAPMFERVLELRPTRTAVWLYLGQARFALGQHEEALEAFRRGEKVGRKLPGYFLVRARTEAELGDTRGAFATLTVGLTAFPDEAEMLREQAILLVDMGLARAALEKGRAYLAKASRDPYAWLVLGESLRRAGQLAAATELLEEARLRFPEDTRLTSQLAYVYAVRGRHRSAARLFASLAVRDPEFAFEAADQYRVARRFGAASRMNGLVGDAKKKLRQRVAIHLAASRFDRALALLPELAKYDLLDDPTRYALAYAALQSGRVDEAERLARDIHAESHRRLVAGLLDSVAACRARPEGCR